MKLEVRVQVSWYLEKIFQVFSSQTRKVLETSSIFVPSNFEFVALTSLNTQEIYTLENVSFFRLPISSNTSWLISLLLPSFWYSIVHVWFYKKKSSFCVDLKLKIALKMYSWRLNFTEEAGGLIDIPRRQLVQIRI